MKSLDRVTPEEGVTVQPDDPVIDLTRYDGSDVVDQVEVGLSGVAPPHPLQDLGAPTLRRHVDVPTDVGVVTDQIEQLQ